MDIRVLVKELELYHKDIRVPVKELGLDLMDIRVISNSYNVPNYYDLLSLPIVNAQRHFYTAQIHDHFLIQNHSLK